MPAHVPAELVRTFDFRTGLGSCPHETVARLHQGPRIFYSPVSHQQRAKTGHGTWIVTKAEDIRYVLQNPEIFSSAAPRSHAAGETWRLIPLEVDPPEHGQYRALLNPLFSPNRLKALDAPIRAWAVELIDAIAARGACDFVTDFAQLYPIGIFLDLLGLPRSELPKFRGWVDGIVHDAGTRVRGANHADAQAAIYRKRSDRRARAAESLLAAMTSSLCASDGDDGRSKAALCRARRWPGLSSCCLSADSTRW